MVDNAKTIIGTITVGAETLMKSAESEKKALVMGLLFANLLVYADLSICVYMSL
jgi:hypothetical protein